MATGPAEQLAREKKAISNEKQKAAKTEEEDAFLVAPDTSCVQCKKELCDPHLIKLYRSLPVEYSSPWQLDQLSN